MIEEKRLYVVRGNRRNGSSTFDCPTPEWAWRKFQDFTAAQYTDITISDPDGRRLTARELEFLVDPVPQPERTSTVPQARNESRDRALQPLL